MWLILTEFRKNKENLVSEILYNTNISFWALAEEAATQCRFWIGANRFGSTEKKAKVKKSIKQGSDDWSWLDRSQFNYKAWEPG